VRDAPVSKRGTASSVDHRFRVNGPGNPYIESRDILHQSFRIHSLYKSEPALVVERLAGNGQNWRSIIGSVIQTVQQVHCSGSGGCKTNAQSSGVFGPSTCHEGSRFFMPDGDKPDPVLTTPQSINDGIDAIANQPKDMTYIPIDQRVY
jgi:hypothetical protein